MPEKGLERCEILELELRNLQDRLSNLEVGVLEYWNIFFLRHFKVT